MPGVEFSILGVVDSTVDAFRLFSSMTSSLHRTGLRWYRRRYHAPAAATVCPEHSGYKDYDSARGDGRSLVSEAVASRFLELATQRFEDRNGKPATFSETTWAFEETQVRPSYDRPSPPLPVSSLPSSEENFCGWNVVCREVLGVVCHVNGMSSGTRSLRRRWGVM